MIEARAFAKLTLSLRVSPLQPQGLHPVHGRFQSFDWSDRLSLEAAEEDTIATSMGGVVIDGDENLAWRAAAAVRAIALARPPLALTLDKALPVAAGLGGGSADAAAALGMAGALLGVDRSQLDDLAPSLGSDVPFCLVGGSAMVGGTGDVVTPVSQIGGYALGIVVPPIEVSTPAVYRAWDELDGPAGAALPDASVPPGLRDQALANDLTDAAIAVAPEIAEWRSELEHLWQRPVALAGSGPSLFAFFVDRDEAGAAIETAPRGARATAAAEPVDYGWLLHHTDTELIVDSKGRTHRELVW
jgi:4-diphosphocytidyl-2-C-methyl-D-erythritol kinase